MAFNFDDVANSVFVNFYRLPLGKSLLARDQLTSFLVLLASHFASYCWSHLKWQTFLWEINQLVRLGQVRLDLVRLG